MADNTRSTVIAAWYSCSVLSSLHQGSLQQFQRPLGLYNRSTNEQKQIPFNNFFQDNVGKTAPER